MLATLYKMSMLTAECHQVIGLRMIKAALGGQEAAEEVSLMMSEKTDAAVRFGAAYMTGGSLDAMIDDYRGVVQANVSRLAGG